MTCLFTLLILICRAFVSLALLDIALHNTHNHSNTPQDLKRKAKDQGRRDENLKIKENPKPLISKFWYWILYGFSLSFKENCPWQTHIHSNQVIIEPLWLRYDKPYVLSSKTALCPIHVNTTTDKTSTWFVVSRRKCAKQVCLSVFDFIKTLVYLKRSHTK